MDPNVAELQRRMQAAGYYTGPIDGVSGPQTIAAAAKFQQAERQRQIQEQQIRAQELQAQQAQAEAQRAQAEAQKSQTENDPTNRITKMATELGPYAVGIGTGTAIGHYGFGKPYGKADAAQGQAVSRLSQAMDVNPEAKQAQLNKMGRGRMGRNVGQFAAPALLGAAGYATRNYLAPMFEDEQAQDLVRGVGAGENAAALALGTHQLIDTLRRGNPIDPVDEARIRSGAMPPPSTPPGVPPPPASPPPPPQAPQEPIRNSERLRLAAETATGKPLSPKLKKEASYNMMKKALNDGNLSAVAESLNIPSESSRATVLQRAREIMKIGGKSSVMLPLAAGGLAYELSGAPAEAADGSVIPPTTADRLGAASVASGAVAGTQQLMRRLPEGIRQFGGRMLNAASAPMVATDITSEIVQRHMPREGQESPGFMSTVGGVAGDLGRALMGQSGQDQQRRNASEMATVPPRNPMFSDPREADPRAAYNQQTPGMVHSDPDVARAWQKSPRQTIIELTRSSGLGPEDIAMLAGINVGDVKSIMSSIPRQALSAR